MVDYKTAKGWLTERERELLAELSGRVLGDGTIINIGVEYGASVHCLRAGNSLPHIIAFDLIGADKFDGEIPVNTEIIQADSHAVAKEWDAPIDLIFIDGDHRTIGVLADCEFLKHVRPGGIVAFHDCFISPDSIPVNLGVSEWFNRYAGEWRELPTVDSIRVFERAGWPDVTVIIPTYNRAEILARCLRGLDDNLKYSGQIHYLVGIDGTDHTAELLAAEFGGLVTTIPGPQRGLGANLNALIAAAQTDYLFQMDDDHLLLSPLYLSAHMRRLVEDPSAGWIRLMWIGRHRYEGSLDGYHWRVRWDSPELYIPSCRPHIKKRSFHDFFGLYREDLKLGMTEIEFCLRCKEAGIRDPQAPSVLVPLGGPSETGWDHIGDSWQARGL